ncbi:potassium-transporting ATPase subunit KdpC [Nocardioides sp. CN2-186]|uniref:potassium-transporting ATPase subunit KdpC n=1 Tax=Nocardioides tweenelious TaxID=3156607 RepID=UPI0032B32F6D
MKDLYTLFRHSLAGLRVLVAMTLLLGVAYPLAVTGIAQVAFPWHADGSLVTATGSHTTDAGQAVGSAIIGQTVDDDGLFQNRPSAAGDGYDMLSTYGTNLGPNNPDLVASIKQLKAEVAERERVDPSDVPPDAVTSSASGLDPDISPAYAAIQVPRVAAANDLSEDAVRRLVAEHTSGRTWGVLGEPRVNVLELNIAVRVLAGS